MKALEKKENKSTFGKQTGLSDARSAFHGGCNVATNPTYDYMLSVVAFTVNRSPDIPNDISTPRIRADSS